MSAHYLVDLFASPFSTAAILDVHSPPSGQSRLQGALVIRVPDTVPVVNPTNLSDLLTKKYQGVLASFAGFPNVAYDDLLDVSGLDLSATGTKGSFGDRGTVILADGGIVETVLVPLGGSDITQCVVTWENYTVTNADPATGILGRTYAEVAPGPGVMTCQVSVDGGTTFQAALDGAVLNIPLLAQGTDLVLRWTNTSGGRVGLGSWAFVY